MALRVGEPVELRILYPDLGVEESSSAAAPSYGLDQGALIAAAQAALAAPLDRRDAALAGSAFRRALLSVVLENVNQRKRWLDFAHLHRDHLLDR